MSQRATAIRRASWVGILGNGFLAVLKITVGIIAGFAAVIADGIDSASDILGSLITFFVAGVSENPPDKSHPWGRKRMETIATMVLAIFILFAGLQLVIGTASTLLSEEARALPGKAALFVTLFFIIGKAGRAVYKYRVAKKVESTMVRADVANMKNDIFLSLGVLVGLAITYLTNLSVIDTMARILIGGWIIINGAKLSLETNVELEDGIDDQDGIYEKLFAIARKTPGFMLPKRHAFEN